MREIDFNKLVPELLEKYGGESTKLAATSTDNLGLMGAARSGKDTVANYLIGRHEYIKFAFGTKLKMTANDLFGESAAKDRGLYQWFGQECRKIDPDIWIKLMVSDINTHLTLAEGYEYPRFIITDIRQPNERLWAKDNDIKVIKIFCPLETRIDRMIDRGDHCNLEQLRDTTERLLEVMTYDLVVKNDGSLIQLNKRLDAILDHKGLSLYA